MGLNIVVGIPTVGRAAVLREVLVELGRQARRPDAVIVCGTTEADVAGAADTGARVMLGAPGLPRQRNAIIDAAAAADVVLFFDDDFLADPDYIAAIERHLDAHPGTVVATGRVLADGINGPGLTPEQGRAILRRPAAAAADAAVFTGYGCNMAVRLAPMRAHALRFDERLPLYAWQEDVDLSRRLAPFGGPPFGGIVNVGAAKGVHLGVKVGRGKGVRLGYSQVANPLYLSGKRTGYPLARALKHIARNLAMNVARSMAPEPYVDRRGRLLGNMLAIRDLAIGRMAPERILQF
jgi:glycosyltransferase involved in cell wall biosynthesis